MSTVVYLKDRGLCKVLGVDPPVSPANTHWEGSVDLGSSYEGYLEVDVDAGSPLNLSLPDMTITPNLFDEYIEDLTSTDGFSVELGEDLGVLGEKIQNYLHEKGFGDITLSAGSISFTDGVLKLNNFNIRELTQANFAPYKDMYPVTVNLGVDKEINIDNLLISAAIALVITLAIYFAIKILGIAAASDIIIGLGSAFIQQLSNALS